MRAVFRAVVLSVALGLVFPLLYATALGYGVHYRTPMDPAAFYSLPFERQQQWLRENEVRGRGLEFIRQRVTNRHFWTVEYLPFAGYTTSLLFVACLLMAWWDRRGAGFAASNKVR